MKVVQVHEVKRVAAINPLGLVVALGLFWKGPQSDFPSLGALEPRGRQEDQRFEKIPKGEKAGPK